MRIRLANEWLFRNKNFRLLRVLSVHVSKFAYWEYNYCVCISVLNFSMTIELVKTKEKQ